MLFCSVGLFFGFFWLKMDKNLILGNSSGPQGFTQSASLLIHVENVQEKNRATGLFYRDSSANKGADFLKLCWSFDHERHC
jgi:hypothetical protein